MAAKAAFNVGVCECEFVSVSHDSLINKITYRWAGKADSVRTPQAFLREEGGTRSVTEGACANFNQLLA